MASQPPGDGRRRNGGDRAGGSGGSSDENVVPFQPRKGRSRRSGLSEAQQYHPRGRTVRQSAEPARTPRQAADARRAASASGSDKAASGTGRGKAGSGTGRGKAVSGTRGGKAASATGRGAAARGAAAGARTAGRRGATPRAAARSVRGTGVRRGGRGVTTRHGQGPPPPRRQQVHLPPRRPRRPRGIARLGNPSARLRVSLAVLLALFAAVGGRLVQIQTTEGSQYAALAADSRRVSVELFAPRGAILDRDGNVLAHDVQGATIAADPGYIDDRDEVAAAVAPLLGMTTAAVAEKLSHDRHPDGTKNRYVVLKKKVPLAVGDKVNALREKIPGLIVQEDQVREVPGGPFAANLLGYTGADGTGLAGLESSYNELLQGVDGERIYDEGTGGQEIPDGYHETKAAKAGSDLVLTIDRDLQYQTNKLLAARVAATKAYMGSAIVMDARTGEILAMASAPTYDASNPSTAKKGTTLDLATAAVVEPGSVHKALTVAAGLDAGVIGPNTVLDLPDQIYKGRVRYTDTHQHTESSRYTLMGVLAQSSNIGTIMIADKLGSQRLYDYQRAFGLGSKTGIGLPGESAGIVQPPANWSGPSAGSIPIGLGVAVTPLQMTALYATLANGGMKVSPTLVRSIVGSDGTVRATDRPKPERVVSKEAADTVVRDMTAIATKEGTAPLAAVPGYIVSGKTGTGSRAEGNKYLDGNVTSFIGIVPADSPRYVISVIVHTPSQSVGGAIAGPTFSDLAGFTLRRYGVSPSGAAAPPITLYG